MQGLLAQLDLDLNEAGFMGDDLIDLQVMAACGFSAAPGDAHDLANAMPSQFRANLAGTAPCAGLRVHS